MSRPCTYLFILFLLLTFPALAAADEIAPQRAPEETQVENEQAFELLENIADSIPSLRSFENRVYLASAVADLLWTKDEKRARVLFHVVTKEIALALANLDPSDQLSNNSLGMIQQQRRETLDRMARRDPDMALAFLHATSLPAGFPTAHNHHYTSEIDLELHLATLLVAKNPDQASQIARATLGKGVSHQLISLLSQFGEKNQAAAHMLHKDIVDKLKTEDLLGNHDAANVGWSLLGSFPPPLANDDTYRELVETLTGVLSSVSTNSGPHSSYAQIFYSHFSAAMPLIEKHAPAQVAALRRWSQAVTPRLDPTSRIHQEINELASHGTVDELLASASKYAPEHKANIYQQAVWKALNNGDANRARQIVSEFIQEPMQRRQMLEQIDSQVLWRSISENKVAEVRQMSSKIQNVEQRIQILISLAANVASRGDKKQALDLLAEAAPLLDALPSNPARLTGQLQLAQAYSSLDMEQTGALIEPLIRQVNELVSAAVVLDGFENKYLQDGEWSKRGYSGLTNLVNNLEQQLGMLARQNVDRARSLSNQLERPEIRLMAQLEIAQALLTGRRVRLQTLIRRHR